MLWLIAGDRYRCVFVCKTFFSLFLQKVLSALVCQNMHKFEFIEYWCPQFFCHIVIILFALISIPQETYLRQQTNKHDSRLYDNFQTIIFCIVWTKYKLFMHFWNIFRLFALIKFDSICNQSTVVHADFGFVHLYRYLLLDSKTTLLN